MIPNSVPARPYKPRDKAKVEAGVLLVERWIVAALRHRKFFLIEALNQAIGELRDRINQRPFRRREGSRASQFAALDKPALEPLPAEPFDLSQWSRARVNIDYHIAFDANYYSVPYNLVQELIEVRSTPTTVEIFHKGQRVASHLRARGHGNAVTIHEHRPRSHQAHLEWTPSRMVHWSASIGPHTARLFERILADKPHPEMGYRSCLGIIRLAEKYSPARMEVLANRCSAIVLRRSSPVREIVLGTRGAAPTGLRCIGPNFPVILIDWPGVISTKSLPRICSPTDAWRFCWRASPWAPASSPPGRPGRSLRSSPCAKADAR